MSASIVSSFYKKFIAIRHHMAYQYSSFITPWIHTYIYWEFLNSLIAALLKYCPEFFPNQCWLLALFLWVHNFLLIAVQLKHQQEEQVSFFLFLSLFEISSSSCCTFNLRLGLPANSDCLNMLAYVFGGWWSTHSK